MKIDQFPTQYEAQRDLKAANDVAAERKRSDSRQESIRKAAQSSGSGALIGFFLGIISFVVGFFVCCNVCDYTSFVVALAAWIAITLAGFGLGLLVGHLFLARDIKNEKNPILKLPTSSLAVNKPSWKSIHRRHAKLPLTRVNLKPKPGR